MPVMDGLELLKQVNEEYPSIVFVMLSNLQEFQAAKEAISNRAVEYLLKSQLEPELLEDALNKAKKEASHRSALIQADRIQYYDTVRQKELIHNACMELLFSPDITSETHAADILLQSHMFDGYGLLYISLDFSSLSSAEKSPSKTPATLTAWEKGAVFQNGGQPLWQKISLYPDRTGGLPYHVSLGPGCGLGA